MVIRRGAVMLVIAVFAGACTSGSSPDPSGSASGVPALTILHPADGDQIYGTEVSVLVRVTGTVLGGGIFVYSVDGREVARGPLPTREIKGLPYGPHVLRVERIGPGGHPLDPSLVDRVTFETSQEA
jgi:hypothetical protein